MQIRILLSSHLSFNPKPGFFFYMNGLRPSKTAGQTYMQQIMNSVAVRQKEKGTRS